MGRLGSAEDSLAALEKEIRAVAPLVLDGQLESLVLLAELELAVRVAAVAQRDQLESSGELMELRMQCCQLFLVLTAAEYRDYHKFLPLM